MTIIESHTEKKQLKEAATSLLYHFLTPEYLLSLLNRNSFKLSKDEQSYNGKGRYFLSLTRNRNFKEGYPVIMMSGENHAVIDNLVCRLTIDGEALNTFVNFKFHGKQHNAKTEPFDFANKDLKGEDYMNGSENGKEWMLKSDDGFCTPIGYMDDKSHHPYSQAEDRLTSDVPYLPNADKFITCIEIYAINTPLANQEDDRKENACLRKIISMAKQRNIPIFLYNSSSAFNYSKKGASISMDELWYGK